MLRRKCEAAGRDPGSLTWSAQALVKVTDDPAEAERFLAQVGARPAFAGTPDQFVKRAAALEAVGVGEVIVPDFTLSRGQARLDELDGLRACSPPPTRADAAAEISSTDQRRRRVAHPRDPAGLLVLASLAVDIGPLTNVVARARRFETYRRVGVLCHAR